ncbi:hypothetical protein CSB09_01260 [Candidatus Gracilibacteria bacterium]|nr:MAG: hypothetical protein CSB09_01260 [Candidatus Gracilibacteria bacterium]
MPKIKSILERIKQSPKEIIEMRFQFARYIFGIVVFAYFFVYLMNVGGFYWGYFTLDRLAIITYHLYSLVIITTFWFAYASIEYIILTHTSLKSPMIRVIVGIICLILALPPLLIHTGLISFS